MMAELHPPPCSEEGLPDPGPMTSERLADVAKALGHPARINIVSQFEGDRCHMAQEIADHCDLAQSTVSEHLRILREAGVLFARKDGPRMWYCLRRSVLREFALAVDTLRLTANLVLLNPSAGGVAQGRDDLIQIDGERFLVERSP